MNRWAFLFIVFLAIIAVFCAYDTVSAQPSETVSSYIISDLHHESYPEFSRLVFASNHKTDFVAYELQDPYRIVIDLLGVSFCELQEHVEYDEGLIKSIEIVKTPYAQKPQGLDEYFYAVDYIVITPYDEFPYTASSSDDGKVIALDIGIKAPPSLRASRVSVFLKDEPKQQHDMIIEKDVQDTATQTHDQVDDTPILEIQETIIDLPLIEDVHFENLDDAMLVIIMSNQDIAYTAQRGYYPAFNIVLKPKGQVFTEMEEYVEFDSGYIKSLRIVRDEKTQTPQVLDRYYYPVKYIVIEPLVDLPFDLYANDDRTISILEIYYPDVSKEVEEIVEEEQRKELAEEIFDRQEEKKLKEAAKQEFLQKLKQEIKREDMLREEKIAEIRREELQKRKTEAARKVEHIGQEVLKDLIVKGKGLLGLSQAQSIALDNNPQATTARREVKLAKLKKRDAFRALFPNIKIKASHTEGDLADESGFIEEIYGIEAEHPLYQGGRLMNAYKQSKVNVDLAEARYRKIEHDLNYKVAEAYHSIVTAIMNIRLQQVLLEEAEPILVLAEKRHTAGLSTGLEILNVQSRYNQIQFQIATAERDLALARFKLQQAMGLDIADEDIDLSQVDTELGFNIIDINLNECLAAAASYQPDILVNKLLVESNEYGEKVAKGKEGLRIDLTGFYGRADSYYNTEPKNLTADWNIGVKVSKPFWFASPSYSFTKDKTSSKLGQNDRTGTTVHSGELAMFDKDAFAIGSEIEEAKITKEKAENDLIDIRRQTALAIKEAYYNYQEAVLQVKNSLEKVRFHEEGVKVARMQAELNEALQSQLLESTIQLTDEKSVYVKALSDYNLAIIKLNNAIGVKDYFRID
jgi:outer membrane protein TolC